MGSCKLCNGSGWFYPSDDGDVPEPCDYCNYDDENDLYDLVYEPMEQP